MIANLQPLRETDSGAPPALMADGIARTVLAGVYSSCLARMKERHEATLKFQKFSQSLAHRRTLRSVWSAASGKYESPKTIRKVTMYIGLSGDAATARVLPLGDGYLTVSKIYSLVRSQEWCPSYPFVLVCGTRLLDKCVVNCIDAVFGEPACGKMNLMRDALDDY